MTQTDSASLTDSLSTSRGGSSEPPAVAAGAAVSLPLTAFDDSFSGRPGGLAHVKSEALAGAADSLPLPVALSTVVVDQGNRFLGRTGSVVPSLGPLYSLVSGAQLEPCSSSRQLCRSRGVRGSQSACRCRPVRVTF